MLHWVGFISFLLRFTGVWGEVYNDQLVGSRIEESFIRVFSGISTLIKSDNDNSPFQAYNIIFGVDGFY